MFKPEFQSIIVYLVVIAFLALFILIVVQLIRIADAVETIANHYNDED